jgi:hypothetical protein
LEINMKTIRLLALSLVLFTGVIFPQDKQLYFESSLANNDSSQQINLSNYYSANEKIEGYFYVTILNGLIEGKLVKGGFSFLEPQVLGFDKSSAKKRTLERNEPAGNLDTLTYGIRVEKAVSFSIEPDMSSLKNDSVLVIINYCVYQNRGYEDDKCLNVNYNLKAHIVQARAALNKPNVFNFDDDTFKDYNLTYSINYNSSNNQIPKITGIGKFEKEILDACRNANMKNYKLNFSVDFVKDKYESEFRRNDMLVFPYELIIRNTNLSSTNVLIDGSTGKKINLPCEVYYFSHTFPFRLYNEDKERKYESYKTKNQILKSEYDLIIVPVSLNKDTLEVVVFEFSRKINVDDVMRWTPSSVRLRFIGTDKGSTQLHLAKENWSANFEREGERYDIYGYDDYEKYIDEYVVLNLRAITKQTEY